MVNRRIPSAFCFETVTPCIATQSYLWHQQLQKERKQSMNKN
jgi:hypothetical protein